MLEDIFFGRDIAKIPVCPFCGLPIERPLDLTTRRDGEMPVGACSCGAVYAFDETGHSLGSAMVEALVFGCNMDWDLAWNLLPEEDYQEEIIEHYDHIKHLVIPRGGGVDGRQIAGALYFIRVHKDVQEVTREAVKKRLKKAQTAVSSSKKRSFGGTKKRSFSKKRIEELVNVYDVDAIVDMADADKALIRNLQRLLYSGDDLLRKRAAEILGRVCALVSDDSPGVISRLLQVLFYAITDTAAFSWGAFEAISEIIANRPDLFGGYLPQLYQFLTDDTRRAQTLEAIARIARSRSDLVRKHTFYFIDYLSDQDHRVRGYTALLMGNLGAYEFSEDLERLLTDDHEIEVYKDGVLERKTVALIAADALERL
jgi:hypothetical protein